MNNNSVKEELEKLGYWKSMYQKDNVFGTGETKFANISYKIIKNLEIQSILELGCGQGRDSLFFAEKKFHVTATDFSENAVNFVKESSNKMSMTNVNAHVLDMRKNFPFENKFDCTYSNLALQFFDKNELSKIFKKISNSLKQKGYFMFSTKKPGDKYHKSGEEVSQNAYKTKGITRYFFESKEIEEILEKNFEVIQIGNEEHTNLDNSVSAWWYFITKKL